MRSQTVEAYLGAPNSTGIEPEDVARAGEPLEKWRLAATLADFREFRKKYEAGGVAIEVVKFDAMDKMKDAILDYAFQAAAALGASAISTNVPVSASKRIGAFAAKHKIMVGYHGAEDFGVPDAFASPESWERAMSFSRFNGINLDIGHFVASNAGSPLPFLKKYASRITHIHLTDRKRNNGPFTIWGEGDAPIAETLRAIVKYAFPAIVECEYPLPTGSTGMREIERCVNYCRAALR
jgi:sugar phosphate isomerase/epimerase